MTNKEIKEAVLNKIREYGFKLHKIQNVDGYFIFEGVEDSVTHFYIKGLPHWKFALWIKNTDEEVIQLFTQYDTQIDKFKPSRSSLLLEYEEREVENGHFYELEDMLKFIKRHPLIAYDKDVNFYEYYGKSYFLSFIKNELIESRLEKFIARLITLKSLIWAYIKLPFLRRSKIINEIKITDFEKEYEGLRTTDRYTIDILFKENSTDEEECKLLNFWFHKDKYGRKDWGRYDEYIILKLRRVGVKYSYSYTNK